MDKRLSFHYIQIIDYFVVVGNGKSYAAVGSNRIVYAVVTGLSSGLFCSNSFEMDMIIQYREILLMQPDDGVRSFINGGGLLLRYVGSIVQWRYGYRHDFNDPLVAL